MIVGSLLLILVAVVLLVAGLVGGSSGLLVASIGASLLAAVALVVGARQAAAARAAADPGGLPGEEPEPVDTEAETDFWRPTGQIIPVQFTPAADGTGGSGWRQPPGSPVAGPESTGGDPERPAVAGDSDEGEAVRPAVVEEPGVQEVSAADAARVARLDTEVLVVDGRPRYHIADCPHLSGHEAEPLPVAEAVELGFTPCAGCAPDTVLLADACSS